jgi:hypothetical protein
MQNFRTKKNPPSLSRLPILFTDKSFGRKPESDIAATNVLPMCSPR